MPSSSTETSRNSGRRSLVILALVCIAPLVASYLFYYVWRPEGARNYGELIAPTPVPELAEASADVAPFDALKGKWVMVVVDQGACPEPCQARLWLVRQLRLTQGKEMDRVARVWVVTDEVPPDPVLLAEHEGMVLLKPAQIPGLMTLLDAREAADHIFLVDPLGNLMMRFPKDPDPNRMKKDLIHLLKVSRIG
jgi:hypothetical protein